MTTTFELFCKSIQHLCSKFHKILPVSLLVIEDFHCPYTSINILVHLVKLLLITFAIILAIEQKTTVSLHYTILLFSGSQSLLLWNCFAPSYWNSNDTFWWKTMQNVSRSIALTRGFSTNYRNKNGLTLTLILPWILPLDVVLFRWFTSVAWLVLEF